jgi:lipoate---protein ligase
VRMCPSALALIDVQLTNPGDHLQFDEELLAAGKGVLRFWETARECVVLGQSGQHERDVNLDACQAASVPVLRRCSGGGVVLLGPGCLNYAIVLPLAWNPAFRDVRYSLRWVMERIRQGLRIADLRTEGHCDLALHARKVSGNAQRRTQSAILHHGTILYDFDASRAELFLRPPHRQPHYRAGRSHRDFIGNVPLGAAEIRKRLANAWCRHDVCLRRSRD